MFMALAHGQEELRALVIKEKKKKKKKAKKSGGVLNIGRRFRGPSKWALEFVTPSNEGDNQEKEDKKTKEEENNPETDKEEADYAEEQYPSAGDKYK